MNPFLEHGASLRAVNPLRTITYMHTGPSITAEALIAELVQSDVITEGRMISALGEHRHGQKLAELERLLIEHNVLSANRLLLLKGVVAGLDVLPYEEEKVTAGLPANVAKLAGAIQVDAATPTVAFVEDLPQNLEMVAQAIGTTEYDVWLMTAVQFQRLYQAVYTGRTADQRPPLTTIFDLFDEAIERRASDIHLSVGIPPRLRVDGHLISLHRQEVDQEWIRRELEKIAGEERLKVVGRSATSDFAYAYGHSRFRCNVGLTINGYSLAVRLLPTQIPTFDEIKLPWAIRRFVELERGMVLVTGPTGSGKSTTLASLLGHIARNADRHIITLEDPVEFILPRSGPAQVDQRELGDSFFSFPDALRQALRQDPDVILVGELRDLETMRTALNAAETGHLVFGTLHTYDAASSVARLVTMFEPSEQDQVRSQLAYILRGIVSQTLIPHASGQGRVAAFEILVGTPAVANNLRKVEGHNQIHQTLATGKADGMQTMEMCLADYVRNGIVTLQEAEYRAKDIDDLKRRVEAPDYPVAH